LREKFRVSGPDAEEMFILHRHASRNQTLGKVGREPLVEVSIPAQLRQVHRGVLIESFMACSLLQSPTPTKAEVGDSTFWQRQFTKDLGFRGIEQAEVLPRLHLGSSLVGSRGGDAERLV
jgi:hypothetical protein